MTQREKDAERVAMQLHRHRMAKHENLCYEDVKTAYIKGCEATDKNKREAREIIKAMLSRPDGDINYEIKARAQEYLQRFKK